MPLDALPPELQDVENHFPDDAAFGTTTLFGKLYYWYQKKTKTWFCFSYRCKEWWAKWRMVPKVLFAIKGVGPWRVEFLDKGDDGTHSSRFIVNDTFAYGGYLSRVQYYNRWHFAIQWPLMMSFHFYFRDADVPRILGEHNGTDGKLFFFYWNHFDNDAVYWMITSIFVGLGWK